MNLYELPFDSLKSLRQIGVSLNDIYRHEDYLPPMIIEKIYPSIVQKTIDVCVEIDQRKNIETKLILTQEEAVFLAWWLQEYKYHYSTFAAFEGKIKPYLPLAEAA